MSEDTHGILGRIDRIDCSICRDKWRVGERVTYQHSRFGTAHTVCIRAILDAEFDSPEILECFAKMKVMQPKGHG